MTLQPVNHLLQKLMHQPAWQHQQRFTHISQLWSQLLPPKSRTNSRPITIQQNILWVATPNTTWAQHLTLQRTRLLAQLNAHLAQPLTDIRFSAAHWQRSPAYSPQADLNPTHPSTLPPARSVPQARSHDPVAAVQLWLQRHQERFAKLPPCPRCHAPTPKGELTRWQMCVCCAAQVCANTPTPFLSLPREIDQKIDGDS